MRWSCEARASRLSCCVTSDGPVHRGAHCPPDLGTGVRGHCSLCGPEPHGLNWGLALPASWAEQELIAFLWDPKPHESRAEQSRTEDGAGAGLLPLPGLSARDCSGPRFSPCAMGQQPELCPLPQGPWQACGPSPCPEDGLTRKDLPKRSPLLSGDSGRACGCCGTGVQGESRVVGPIWARRQPEPWQSYR